jgi:hypothetical protein
MEDAEQGIDSELVQEFQLYCDYDDNEVYYYDLYEKLKVLFDWRVSLGLSEGL